VAVGAGLRRGAGGQAPAAGGFGGLTPARRRPSFLRPTPAGGASAATGWGRLRRVVGSGSRLKPLLPGARGGRAACDQAGPSRPPRTIQPLPGEREGAPEGGDVATGGRICLAGPAPSFRRAPENVAARVLQGRGQAGSRPLQTGFRYA